jgi:transglutaminase-like putative cysteine protease
MTALDDFDGTIWRSTYDTTAAGDDLPTSVDDNNTTTTQVTQTITIQALDVIWLPGAYQPISFQAGGNWDADFDRDSGTLIVDKKSKSSDGLTYTVVSEIPTPQREELRSASPNVPGEIIDRYTDLPKKFPAQVTNLAERLTADKETEYDKALAIMDYLRNSGTFEYNKETVRPGHDDEALVDFLFTSQEGYCEQFAGSFAALARSVGLPTRVAVGFTPGEQDPREPTLWKITGRQAHAWAEVYFEGYGWVIFDPTPGRAPTGAESWLGVQPAQELPAGIQTGDSAPSDATTPGATDPSSAGPAPGGGTPGAGNIDTGGIEVPSPQRDEGGSNLVPKAMGKAARPLGYGFLGYLVLVPLLMVGVRSFRRLRARAPAEKVDLAWREANEEAAESGIKLNDSLTVAERALRMRAALPDLAPQIDLVARWVEQVHYAEASPTSEDATLAAQAAAEVVAAANRRQVWYVRLLRYFDIRRLMPRPDHARRSAQSVVRTALRTN